MNSQKNQQWGFISQDGFFQPLSSLTVAALEYVDKSLVTLHSLLQENCDLEKYEQCAVIRDEISKRPQHEAIISKYAGAEDNIA